MWCNWWILNKPIVPGLFSLIEEGAGAGLVSMLSVCEIMQGSMRAGKIDIAMDIKKYLLNFPHLHCREDTAAVLDFMGADKRVDWNKLRTMDALIIASGLGRLNRPSTVARFLDLQISALWPPHLNFRGFSRSPKTGQKNLAILAIFGHPTSGLFARMDLFISNDRHFISELPASMMLFFM